MRFALLILATSAVWAATAFGRVAQSSKDRHDLRVLVSKYALCVVRAHHNQARNALLTDANNDDIMKHYSVVIDSDCMNGIAGGVEVTFPSDLYRYALADALVRNDYLKAGLESFADRLPLAQLTVPTQANFDRMLAGAGSSLAKIHLRESYDNDRIIAELSLYGECVARAHPVDVRLWILTDPDVPEELSRIKALMPAFQQCLPSGSTVKFTKDQLRGAVALNYYRLANATPQPGLGAPH